MTLLAALLAAIGSCGYALGARLQHAAVHDTIGSEGLGARSQLRLVRNSRWLLGLGSLGTGALLHACALGLAPLSVVQPIGVLALPLTVLLTAREHKRPLRELNPNVILAVAAATGGVASFVFLAAGSATPTEVSGDHQWLAAQIVAVLVLVIGTVALTGRSKVRCVAFAAGCAVLYGFVSLLMRAVAQKVGTSWLAEINLLPLIGIVCAMVLGAWMLQHAYASGPPDLVVACLTVIDPLVAVGLGIGLLGEADKVSPIVATGEIVCAVVACAGVFALAHYHPDTEDDRVPATTSGGGSFAGGKFPDSDGS